MFLIYILRKVVCLLALHLRGEIMQWHEKKIIFILLFILFYWSILLVLLFYFFNLFFWSILKVKSRDITQPDACFVSCIEISQTTFSQAKLKTQKRKATLKIFLGTVIRAWSGDLGSGSGVGIYPKIWTSTPPPPPPPPIYLKKTNEYREKPNKIKI